MKTQCILIVIALFLLCGNVANAGEASLSFSSSVYSKYIGKIGGIFSEDPILVNDICWSKGDWFAGVWNSTGIGSDSYGSTYADEIDFYLGYNHTFEWVRIQSGVAYYTIKNLSHMNDDIWAVDGEISLPKMSIVQPYLSFRRFNTVGSKSFPGGTFYWAGLRRTQWGISFDWMTAYSDGALGKDPGLVFTRLTVNRSFALNNRLTLTPSVVLQKPIGGQEKHVSAYTTKNEMVWGITLGYKL